VAPTFNHNAPPTISPTGAFGADSGVHSLVVSPVGAILNVLESRAHSTKDSKRPRNEKGEGKDLEKTGERVGKGQARACWI